MNAPGEGARLGALLELCGGVWRGRITASEACRRARDDAVLLRPADVPAVAAATADAARRSRAGARTLAVVLRAWVDAHAPTDEAVHAVCHALVLASTETLAARPDAADYREAVEAATTMLELAQPGPQRAAAHYFTGMLYLAPFAHDPANTEYQLSQLERQATRAWADPLLGDRDVLPDPGSALRRAVVHLHHAARSLEGRVRGSALAQCAFALHSWREAGGPVTARLVAAVVDDACRVLPADGDSFACARLSWLLVLSGRYDDARRRRIGTPREGEVGDGLLPAVLTRATVVRLLVELGAPSGVRRVAQDALRLVADDPELERYRFFLLLAVAHDLEDDPGTCADHARHQVAAPGPGATTHALLHEPDHAWGDTATLRAAAEGAPSFPGDVRAVFDAVYRYRLRVRSRLAQQHVDLEYSVRCLTEAIAALAGAFPDQAASCAFRLSGLVQLAVEADPNTLSGSTTNELVMVSDAVLRHLPPSFAQPWCEFLKSIVAVAAETGTDPIPVMGALKGLLTASAIGHPGALPIDGETARIAGEVLEDGEDAVGEGWPLSRSDLGDLEAVLGSYLDAQEKEAGRTMHEQARNTRRLAQQDQARRLREVPGRWEPMSAEQVAALLPGDVVVLALSLGPVGPRRASGLHAVIVTDTGATAIAIGDSTRPYGDRQSVRHEASDPSSRDARSVLLSPLGATVADLRRRLADDPGPRAVTPEAAEQLHVLAGFLTPELLDLLRSESTRGRRHLLVWPHESLHAVPFGLLPLGDGLLADHLTVSVIPALECLERRSAVRPRETSTLVVGSSRGGVVVGLPVEASLDAQADVIAAALGVAALTGDQATPERVVDAMATARRVHIGAHGLMDVDAPVHSRLCLTGGPLSAGMVLALDLRHVEIVSLGACDSALLRYDAAGDVHGLVSAFLRAGVAMVIGTLWPIEPDVAHVFFTTFHGSLGDGRRRLQAYDEAVATTRSRYPAYRDWGAFVAFGY